MVSNTECVLQETADKPKAARPVPVEAPREFLMGLSQGLSGSVSAYKGLRFPDGRHHDWPGSFRYRGCLFRWNGRTQRYLVKIPEGSPIHGGGQGPQWAHGGFDPEACVTGLDREFDQAEKLAAYYESHGLHEAAARLRGEEARRAA